MSIKNLLAFVLGGVVIGGVVFFVARRTATPAVAPAPAPVAENAPAAASSNAAAPAPGAAQSSKPAAPRGAKPAREAKPAKADHSSPAPMKETGAAGSPVVAQNAPPAPAPEPIAAPAAPLPAPAPKRSEAAAILRPDAANENAHRTPQTVTIPAGTTLTVRLREALDTGKQSAGDPFTATADAPLVIEGFVLVERGAAVRGKISDLTSASRVKGHAAITLELTQISTSDGQKVDVHTTTYHSEAAKDNTGKAVKVGAVSAIGAIIGAMAGGGKGAAIGAGAGAGVGAGGVMATKGAEVRLPSETRLSFKLSQPVTLTEKLN
jgi:hypothetical protein